jgi:serine/threonine protein kinase/outer membrane biosynthesis protein TonB
VASNHLGRYEIIKTLARGALTDLLVGRASGMEGFQRYVAIKLLRAEFAAQPLTFESFVNEARLAAVLHHHNIVQVHDIGEDRGQPYFAMEYVHGVDLRTLLAKLAKRNEQLPLQHVVQIVASVAAALHHAHEQRGPDGQPLGIVHRDVSPGNVLVGFDGNVKVVDFGIAKAAIGTIQSDAGVLKGQAPYMSPEQCAGKPVDRRSDVFALGIVLYELATVRRLFKGANEFLTMSAVVNAEVPKPSQYRRDIPAPLEAIMLKALARDPARRFQTAGEMSLALDKVASSVGVGASTTALANYMRLQFGDQKEPWLRPVTPVDDEDDDYSEVTEVDFDGGASGLAPPPSEAAEKNAIPRMIGASKSSPIVAARTHAMTPAPEKARLAMPPPRSRPLTKQPPPLPPVPAAPSIPAHASSMRRNDEVTEVDALAPTEVANVRSSPLQLARRYTPDASATAIVEPLATVQYAESPKRRNRSRRTLWLMLTALLAGGGAVAAVVLWPGADISSSSASEEPERIVVEMAKHEPAPVTVAEPTKPAMEMTQADYERERKAAAAAAQDAGVSDDKPAPIGEDKKPAPVETQPAPIAETKPEPVEAKPTPVETKPAPVEKNPDIEPVAKKVAPAKRTTTKTPAKRTVAKAAAKPAPKKAPAKKPAAKKPKWNPDDLFLEDK